MADLELQSAILQSALEALDGEAEDGDPVEAGSEDGMEVEAGEDAQAQAQAQDDAEAHFEVAPSAQDAGDAEARGVEEDAAGEPTGEGTKQMLPPPNGRHFETRDAAESFLKVYCAQQGYSVSCRRCLRKGIRGFKAYFYCSCGRPGDAARERNTKNTKKTGCQMGFSLDCLQRTNYRWTIDSSITQPHNHGPAVKTVRPVVPFPRRRKTIDAPGEQAAVGKLLGRRALITGGDTGIGRSVAVLFAREGADMSIVYLPHEQKDAERTQRLVEAEGQQCLLIPGNFMDARTCKAAVETHVNRFGMISVLVNNASKQTLCDDITKIDLDAVESTFRTNIVQMFAMSKYAVPHIERGGSIVNTTSTHAERGSAMAVDFSATQGAVVSFTRSLSKQLMPKGIRVNAIALASKAAAPQRPAQSSLALQPMEGSSTDLPIGTNLQLKEIARSFVFLAGMESSSLSGQVLTAHPVDD